MFHAVVAQDAGVAFGQTMGRGTLLGTSSRKVRWCRSLGRCQADAAEDAIGSEGEVVDDMDAGEAPFKTAVLDELVNATADC